MEQSAPATALLPAVVSDNARDAGLAVQAASKAGIKAYTWQEFLDLGRQMPAAAVPPKPEDLCTIMYTSGTTGDPKVSRPSHQQHCLTLPITWTEKHMHACRGSPLPGSAEDVTQQSASLICWKRM